MEILWLIIILLAIGIVIVLVFFGVASAFSPSSPNSQIKEFSNNMLGFEFTDGGYEILESKSINNHPDRPQGIRIRLTDEEFSKLMKHIEALTEGEKETRKDGTIYIDTITKQDDRCCFIHTSTHSDCNYMFYKAEGVVDYVTKEVSFKSSFY
jgi:hypothetical protein